MRVSASVKKRCEHCKFTKRRNAKGDARLYIYCSKHKRHNQRQG